MSLPYYGTIVFTMHDCKRRKQLQEELEHLQVLQGFPSMKASSLDFFVFATYLELRFANTTKQGKLKHKVIMATLNWARLDT